MNEQQTVPSEPWYEAFRHFHLQLDWLPDQLSRYIRCQSTRFGASPDFVAVTTLAQLAGICAGNNHIETTAGNTSNLMFTVIVAVPQMPGYCQALGEANNTLQKIQQERLEEASRLDRKRIEEMRRTPDFMLPDYATRAGDGDTRKTADARMQVIRIAQQPLFWLESPGFRELREGFADSFDRTVFTTFSSGTLMENLTAPRMDRESQRLAGMLARLMEGAQIEIPGKDECRLIQPRFGMIATASRSSLEAAITSDRPNVQSLVRHSILLAFEDSEMPTPVEPDTISSARAYFTRDITDLLYARRSHGIIGFEQKREFEATLDTWTIFLKQVADRTPEHLRSHLPVFSDLPLKLTCLYLAIAGVALMENNKIARVCIEFAKWLLARTLICASDAHAKNQQANDLDAREVMLAKIVELGPIPFWKLRRRFKVQNRERHQPVLDALIEEGRVCLDTQGKLVAT